ncbi:MAG: rod shape-determining protein RodA [Acinetobacter sp. GWC1_38_13]|jgi:rod shape determining protein RodA|uniref:Peptidoglycan glycosyltransferase MrdB n=1 Tax=Acinetobacter junii TaxID=40215 RepID=A0A350ED35_ACIJU|nr:MULTISPECIES: rod shape-determining protein RodA [Acinetobacter]MBY3627036.1 rod shape-determining protein RodA [Acinetobacter sp. CUI P1]MDA3507859.1 rod shape-determining protein RodA [Acinetobacter junii]MDA3533923.1 rod shape-determining protein RodA [Acinetobacter junii]MDH1857889.1 rod shape-determining protein RodA [Acinetobacter junii]OFW42187.1 MAG: rod shape-determining protein RodA [Acinetobacter sp. GWC1_38_13]
MKPVPQSRFLRYSIRDGLHLKNNSSYWHKLHLDPWLLSLLILNAILGLIVVYSASAQDMGLVFKQGFSFLLGFVALFVCAQVPPKVYQAFSPYLYAVSLVLLIAVFFIGEVRMGARRWIAIPLLGSMQPSELMKFAMPLMITWFLSRNALPPRIFHILISLALIVIPLLLVALQPDLGAGILILTSGLFVLFLAGISWKLILGSMGLVMLFLPIAWTFLLESYQKKRITTLIDPEADVLGSGWNIIQSKIAIGSGGFSGKGYLQGTQSHFGFLPERHTDFIMSTYAEEFGFIGVVILFSLYAAIIIRCFMIGLNSFNNFGRLIVGSLALSFFLYVVVNSGMVSGIFPVTGDPLPFMSYGGTAIITLLAGFGIVMSVHTHR